METSATILHADLDAFYASVEQLLDPSLRGKPIAVGGGVVLAASYEAKAFGISGGMSGRRARELCPQLIFVGGHFKEYQRLGDAAINVLNDFTPLVERISIDKPSPTSWGAPISSVRRLKLRLRYGAVCGQKLAFPSRSAWRAPSTWQRFPRYRPHPSHFHLDLTLEWIDRIKPKRAILTNSISRNCAPSCRPTWSPVTTGCGRRLRASPCCARSHRPAASAAPASSPRTIRAGIIAGLTE
jgi:hypothetical protein